jgi:Amidohydrolase family
VGKVSYSREFHSPGQAVLNHQVDWIVSDHACCSAEQKRSAKDPNNIWLAKSGFGGTEYLLSGIFSEGSKRGMSYNQMAKLLSWNPSQRFGLLEKGDIAIGYDADLVLVDPNETFSSANYLFCAIVCNHSIRGLKVPGNAASLTITVCCLPLSSTVNLY